MSTVIDNWNPEDKLGRKESADFLTNHLIKRYALASKHNHPDTFVLNIRADWGFGKSFFLQRWEKDLKQANFPVVFFNAWENDFCDDPLIGFISEINNGLSDHFKEIPLAKRHLDEAIAIGRKLIKPVSIGIASAITKQISGLSIEKFQELYSQSDASSFDEGGSSSEAASLLSQYSEVALKEHLNTKETIVLFKRKLERLIETLQKEASIQLPLFIFIDELDRCRPTYAIELLEAIKHLFGVPGVYFIVATNLEQLGHSICAVYGEQFDSERYLKRFFDQEYLLPSPDNTRFTAFLFERYSLNDFGTFYTVIENGLYGEIPSEQALFSILCDSFRLGPRDQEQVAGALQAILMNWPKGEMIHLAYLLFLIIAKQMKTSLFQQLSENRLSDYPNFFNAISTHLRESATFKTKDVSNLDRFPTIEEHKVSNMLWTYQDVLKMTCRDLLKEDLNPIKFPEKIIAAVRQSCPGSYSLTESPTPPISDYARRVSQAGQLIMK
ncbi:MAG: P-loop NTPase fold protein [Sideroxydans sp.]|nr:P-loop NTPase fold protein [Sideroxydans sp.]